MNYTNWFKFFADSFFKVVMPAAFIMVTACSKTGTVTSTDGGSINNGAIGITKVYPTSSGASWTAITSASRYYIKGLDLTVTGTCSAGTAVIRVDEGAGDYAETSTCGVSGTFTWRKVYTAITEEGNKTLTFTSYDISDVAISGATTTVDVRVDDTAPANPVVTTPGGSPYVYSGSVPNFDIIGTVSVDTVAMTGPASVVVTLSGTNWTYNAAVTDGASLDFTFYAYDLAGNVSASTTQTIDWSPSISLKFAGIYPTGGEVSDIATSSGFTMESTVSCVPDQVTDGVSLFTILSGFNEVINQVRVD